ncbi:MAG: hypothetical protein E6Q99_09560 [Elusimicrobia bacterium]|jgi:hypothetical protein|nr:MAG: hypothetical protein E6Q99_09560 [Elusimicrobiota bacterium]
MKKLVALGWLLVLSPALAFVVLAMAHPVGDPQSSASGVVRLLDFLGTYWVRQGVFIPPPLLAVGEAIALGLYRRTPSARPLAWTGGVFLALWLVLMGIPFLIHVN